MDSRKLGISDQVHCSKNVGCHFKGHAYEHASHQEDERSLVVRNVAVDLAAQRCPFKLLRVDG